MTKAITIFSCANDLHKIAIIRWSIVMLIDGKSVQRDIFLGEEYLRRSAQQGESIAQVRLGVFLFERAETRYAMPLLEAGAKKHVPDAAFMLFTIYAHVGEYNLVCAAYWLKRAAAAPTHREDLEHLHKARNMLGKLETIENAPSHTDGPSLASLGAYLESVRDDVKKAI